MLSWSPYVFIESPAGMGKSSFIKEYTQHKTLFPQKEIEQWAKANQEPMPILFIDEANIVDTDWTQFSGLFDTPPTIFINGQNHILSAQHKVIFAGNPVSYGGGRIQQRLFLEHPAKVIFPPMSPAYIYQHILKPILIQTFDENDAETIAKNIFKKYDITHFSEPEKYGITARDLQLDALKYCAIRGYVEELHMDIKRKHEHLELPISSLSPASSDYFMTPSRRNTELELQQLLRIRHFRRQIHDAPDSALYGGKSALLLDGPPGVGKSEFIAYELKKQGYTQPISDPTDVYDLNASYYFIPASLSPALKLELLEQAFQKGALVCMEEINSSPFAERYLNAYLMGEDINGNRPENPGFMLIGTANAASLRGRKQLSPAVKSRSVSCHLEEYTQDELIEILQRKNPSCPMEAITDLVQAFVAEQAQAQRNPNKAMPTLRDLLTRFHQEYPSPPVSAASTPHPRHEPLIFSSSHIYTNASPQPSNPAPHLRKV
jgi:hypothetical protein